MKTIISTTTYNDISRMVTNQNTTQAIHNLENAMFKVLGAQAGYYPGVEIKLNGRLKNSLGRFVLKTSAFTGDHIYWIEISKKQALMDLSFGTDYMVDILKHELCHYMVFMDGGDYCDGAYDFEQKLAEVGASSSGATREDNKISRVDQHYYAEHDIYKAYDGDRLVTTVVTEHTTKDKYLNKHCTVAGTPVEVHRVGFELIEC